MGLPFLDRKKMSSVISSRRGRSPDIEVKPEVEAPGSEMDSGLKSAAEDLLRAIESKSVMDVAKALKCAHEICESLSPEDYDE